MGCGVWGRKGNNDYNLPQKVGRADFHRQRITTGFVALGGFQEYPHKSVQNPPLEITPRRHERNSPHPFSLNSSYLEKAPGLVEQVAYIPLTQEGYHLTKITFQKLKVGTVFGGKSEFNLTLGELLRKQAQFEQAEK